MLVCVWRLGTSSRRERCHCICREIKNSGRRLKLLVCATYDLMAQFIAKYFVVRNSAYHYPHNSAQHKSVNTEILRQQVRAHFSWLYAPVREECSLPGSIFRWRAQLLTHAYSGCGRKYRWGYMAYGWVGMRWGKKNDRDKMAEVSTFD